jgi:hypothetical protein
MYVLTLVAADPPSPLIISPFFSSLQYNHPLHPTHNQDETTISNFVRLFGRQPMVVWHDQKLGETLSLFRKGR